MMRAQFLALVLMAALVIGCTGARMSPSSIEAGNHLAEAQRYLQASDTIAVFTDYHGAGPDTRYVIAREYQPFTHHVFEVPLCDVVTSGTLYECTGTLDDEIRAAHTRIEDVMDRVHRLVHADSVTREEHEARIEYASRKTGVELVRWSRPVERDSAIVTKFGPLFRPTPDLREYFPFDVYVTGSITYSRNYLVQKRIWVDFMVGIDRSGAARQLYIHPGQAYEIAKRLE